MNLTRPRLRPGLVSQKVPLTWFHFLSGIDLRVFVLCLALFLFLIIVCLFLFRFLLPILGIFGGGEGVTTAACLFGDDGSVPFGVEGAEGKSIVLLFG